MNKILVSCLLFFRITAICCCASTRIYQVQVNGYTDRAGALLAPGDSFFVIENPKAKNPLMEKEIKSKIENLLLKYGYILAPYDEAQFHLFFAFGLGTPQTVTVTGPIGPGRCFAELGYTAYLPEAYGPYCTDTFTLYGRWLRLTVVEGKYYRETGKSRTVWIGEVRSTGISSNLREVLDPLLVAAFEQFGKNTGKVRTTIIKQNDPRVEELERVL